jgi:RNA polymerase II subunit A small phosphatase-like protein
MANNPRRSLRERIFANSGRKKQPETDGDRERGSLSITLTTNSRRTPFYKRKTTASAAELSSTASSTLIKSSSRSFLSKVVTKVVPCVSAPLTPTDPLNIATPLKDLTRQDAAPSPLPALDLDISPPLAAGFSITPAASIPPSPADSDVVVPPPVSAILLPDDETDGMTSGAVQPPGSSGTTETFHTPATLHDTATDDSDRTSFSDDEHIHEQMDEEERLIRNGGSGIPIGPVRNRIQCQEPSSHALIF